MLVQAIIDTSGRAEPPSVKIIQSPNPGFDQPAKNYVLRALFRQILTRIPDIHVTAEPELMGTNFIRGIKRQQVAFTPES